MKINFRKRSTRHSVRAITPVIATIMMIGLTIAVGFAAWAWARSAATNSESNFGNAIGSDINYVKENFEVANVNFSSTSPQSATLWIYNNGNSTVYIKQIWISNTTISQTYTSLNATITPKFNCYCLVLHSQTVVSITLSLTSPTVFGSGVLYQFKALGVYGNTNTFQQTR